MLNGSTDEALAPAEAVRLANAAVADFRAECFWFRADGVAIETVGDVKLVVEHLRRQGGRPGWFRALEIERCL